MGALCCVGADLAVLGALGRVGRGFGSGGRAGLCWARDLAVLGARAGIWLWWARWAGLGADLAFGVWSTFYRANKEISSATVAREICKTRFHTDPQKYVQKYNFKVQKYASEPKKCTFKVQKYIFKVQKCAESKKVYIFSK